MISRVVSTSVVALALLAKRSDAALCKIHSLSYSTSLSVLDIQTTALSSTMASSITLSDTTSIVSTQASASSSDLPPLSTSSVDTPSPIDSTTTSEIAPSETETSLEITPTSDILTSDSPTAATTTAQVQSTTTFSPAISSAPAVSYIYNAGFDIPDAAVPVLTSWSLDPNSMQYDFTFYRDGPGSLKIANIYTPHIASEMTEILSHINLLQPDTDYTFSVWFYPTASDAKLSIEAVELHCFNAYEPALKIGSTTTTIPLSWAGTWQQATTTCRFTASQIASNKVGVAVDYTGGTYAGGLSWFDTASFVLA